jgi:hypothetical protein
MVSALVFHFLNRSFLMKKFPTVSVALNIFLAALVLWLLRPRHLIAPSARAPAAKIETNSLNPPSSPSPQNNSPPRAFRWSQLESTNYRTYIGNLRGIGCPEQTVRDIIGADIDEAFYLSRREALKQEQVGPALENSLGALAEQETELLTTLLSAGLRFPSSVASSPPGSTKFAIESKSARDLEKPASLPLIFQPEDLAALKLSEIQIQTITELRQNFMSAVGTNQDSNDPAYRQRWQAARRESDNMLAGMLGRNFILRYQEELGNQATRPN